jgi:hypothetical protein
MSRAHPPPSAVVDRIVAHEDRLAEAASQVFVLSSGRVIRQPAFPHVFDANVIRHPRLDLVDVDGTLHRLGAPLRAIGARHLQLVCDAEPLPDGMKAALRARGFLCDRLLAMRLPGAPSRRASPEVEVCAVPSAATPAEYADTMERMTREEPWYSPPVSREIIGSLEAKAATGVMRLHVARLGGRASGAAGLSIDAEARVASVLTVGTVAEARNRQVAQTMVVTLAERAFAAGCDLVYLLARADDTPKEMYRKFGFEVSFGFEVWLRPPR